ncbi:hypothetical protein ACFX2A_047487 [Malus domestica]
MKGDLALNKTFASKCYATYPTRIKWEREAKELDTYMWNMKRHFKYLKMEDDSKISTAILFLTDNALLWRHRVALQFTQVIKKA